MDKVEVLWKEFLDVKIEVKDVNVMDEEVVGKVVGEIVEFLGLVDVLVCFVGIVYI